MIFVMTMMMLYHLNFFISKMDTMCKNRFWAQKTTLSVHLEKYNNYFGTSVYLLFPSNFIAPLRSCISLITL